MPRSPRFSFKTDTAKARPTASSGSHSESPTITINVAGTFTEMDIVLSSGNASHYETSAAGGYGGSYDETDSTYAPSGTGSTSTFSNSAPPSPTPSRPSSVTPEPHLAPPQDLDSTINTVASSIFSGVDERDAPSPLVQTPLTPINPTRRVRFPMNSDVKAWDHLSIDQGMP
ncbi:uncharacterized protein DFL_005855 [Arthrobotrys flagrans]|uniref:Uncharacterized protein n=1 Tax=Arthrobotrys flagrans TaxID=97331 RepID=A0A436ZYI9_ARTFL|nr:hypothetical protein DFL_005855 [Arthrobotrys flagrans]